MIIMNNKLLKINTRFVSNIKSAPKPVLIPEGTDFIYFANDYQQGIGIPNRVTDSDMGTYEIYNGNDLIVNDPGHDCYLRQPAISQSYRLQIELTGERLTAMKALDGKSYTYYCRVYNTNGTGGIFCWRNGPYGDGYVYMMRSNGNSFQFHTSSGIDTLPLYDGNVIKIYVNSDTAVIKDLDTGDERTLNITTNRTMNPRMTTFWAGYSTEAYLAKMYGLAGIHRETTADEDERFRNILHTQEI